MIAATSPDGPQRTSFAPADRIDTLDGMRGIAVLLVVVYHMFFRWAEPEAPVTLYPHGNLLYYLPWMDILGRVGVLMFFLISGFVIMMTLERSTGIIDFLGRRLARLWPVMLLCATLSVIVIHFSDIAHYYPGQGRWQVTLGEFVSSILFLPPDLTLRFWGGAPGQHQWVAGVYWTLWVEIRFYVLISLVFLMAGRQGFLWAWMLVQGLSTVMDVALTLGADLSFLPGPVGFLAYNLLQPRFLAWFSIGLCGYLLWKGRRDHSIGVIAVLAFVALLSDEAFFLKGTVFELNDQALRFVVICGLSFLPFYLFLRRSSVLRIFRWRPLLIIGLASYPLYLFHELPALAGMKIAAENGIHPWLGVALSIASLILIAILIHRLFEEPAKRAFLVLWRAALGRMEGQVAQFQFR
ncbi:MAG: acyltransferase [Pseudomonadota bacterium]